VTGPSSDTPVQIHRASERAPELTSPLTAIYSIVYAEPPYLWGAEHLSRSPNNSPPSARPRVRSRDRKRGRRRPRILLRRHAAARYPVVEHGDEAGDTDLVTEWPVAPSRSSNCW
jgi:hypothetical protein